MTNTATIQYQSAADLFSMGASAPAFGGYSYMPVGQMVNGTVSLELEPKAKLVMFFKAEQAKLGAKLKHSAPAPKGEKAVEAAKLQNRGFNRYAALTAQHQPKVAGRYASLNAMPKAQPTVAPAPAPTAKVISVSQLAANPANKPNHAGLRLVASNETAPKPAKPAVNSPSAFARRHEKLCSGMGAFNFG